VIGLTGYERDLSERIDKSFLFKKFVVSLQANGRFQKY
jgi:hypothetical protein